MTPSLGTMSISVVDFPPVLAFIRRVAEIEEQAPDLGSYEIRSELGQALETLMRAVNARGDAE